jgi:iron complex outermembrane receptor protein
VQGLELSGLLLLTDSLTASLDLAYIDSVYDKYTGGQCYYGRTPDNDQGQCDLSGEELPGSFELKGIASLQWERPLSSGQFYSRLDMAFGDTINTSSEIDPRFDQPALTLFNARIGWRTARWDISLGGKNLTNVNFVDQSANANVLTPIDEAVGSDIGSYQQYIGAPRELNLTVRMNY